MIALLVLLAANATAVPAVDPATAPAAGPAARCLIVGRQLDYKVVSDRLLLIRAGGRWHRMMVSDSCPGLTPGRILVRRDSSTRLCANDLFEVRDNFTPEVFSLCRFGPMEPLAKGARF
jgi:hypothetical protein